MSKYIRNADGGVHSVNDDFDLPEGWEEIEESEAREANPALFGEQGALAEPAVEDVPEGGEQA